MVLAALCATGLADFRTDATNVMRELRIATHKRGRSPARFGTIPIQSNALRHLGDVGFLQTSIGAELTLLRTSDTCFDTGLILSLSHLNLP